MGRYRGTMGARPSPILTNTLLLVGETSDAVVGRGTQFQAYDKRTCNVLWKQNGRPAQPWIDNIHAQR